MKTEKDRIDAAVRQTLDPTERRNEIARLQKRLPLIHRVMNVFVVLYAILVVASIVAGNSLQATTLAAPALPFIFGFVCYNFGSQRLVQLRVEDARRECEQNDGQISSESALSDELSS